MTHLFLGMSSKAVFSFAFLVLVGVTLLVPGFPPARMLLEYMKIQPTSLSIFGLSAASLLNGILNGFFWVLIGAAIYGVAYAERRKPLPPIPEGPQLSTPPPEPMLVDPRTNKIPPSFTVSATMEKEQFRKELDIEMIDGVGLICGGLLKIQE